MKDQFIIRSGALPGDARVAGFRGSEGLSRPYVIDIYVVMTNDVGNSFDMAAAVGASATLTLDREDGKPPYIFSGIFAAVELISQFLERSVFRATLVPRLWRLAQTMHGRIFANQSIPDIIKAVLQEGGVSSYALRLLGSYPAEAHVCQYRESDLDFICRWMEREGMYYYFEHGEGEETLVITDDRSVHQPLGAKPVRYFPQPGEDESAGECFRTFTCRHAALPAAVRLKDYNYATPAVNVSGDAPVSSLGVGEISLYGARFFTAADGKRLAGVKAQELLAGQVVYHGTGTAWYLRPGYTFELEEHPRSAFNTSYLVTEVEHWGNQLVGTPELEHLFPFKDIYRVEVTAIGADVQYRAPQRTAWPRIYGTENALVDGPATSEYAQIDSHGRYAVKFHFDESSLTGGKASTWVRMLQPHGGSTEGFHFPLRAGTEVMCTFLGGDPDRPVIAGVVPNMVTPSPVTAGNHTRNVIQTGGRNRLELEDLAGMQRMTLSTPHSNSYLRMGSPNAGHNIILHTDGKALHDTGTDLDIAVGGYKHEGVKGEVVETYESTKDEQVTGAVTETYKSTKTETVEGDLTQIYKGTKTETVTLAVTNNYDDTKTENVKGDVTEEYKQNQVTNVTGDQTITVDGNYKLSIQRNEKRYIAGDFYVETKGSNTTTVLGSSNAVVVGLRTNVNLGGVLSNTAGGSISAVEGANLAGTLGFRGQIVVGASWAGVTGNQTSWTGGLIINTIVGGKWEQIVGFKLELLQGVVYRNAPLEMRTDGALIDHILGPNINLATLKFSQRALGITDAALEALL